MDIALLALFAALVAAICQTATDLGTKAATRGADDRSILAAQWGAGALLLSVASVIAYPDLLRTPLDTIRDLTQPQFWRLLAIGGALQVAAYLLYIRAFRLSDASLVAPIILLTPVMMLVTSPLMVGEHVPPLGVFGVLFTVLGVGLLDAREEKRRGVNFSVFFRDAGARSMLATAAIWSITANIDKLGVLASTPLIWITALTMLIALLATLYWLAGARRRPTGPALRYAAKAGAATALGNAVQMWALTVLFTPYVIAIKRLSALFTVLASGMVLKEETGGRLLGAGVMLLGAVMIALARN